MSRDGRDCFRPAIRIDLEHTRCRTRRRNGTDGVTRQLRLAAIVRTVIRTVVLVAVGDNRCCCCCICLLLARLSDQKEDEDAEAG